MLDWIMEKYEVLEHKADFKIRAFGRTKEELFENALLGMEDVLRAKLGPQNSEVRSVKIKSFDIDSLLVDFLSECLYLIQMKKEAYSKVKFVKFSDTELEAELFGKIAERFEEDIKAVTHHQLEVKQEDDGSWEAVVLFDI